MKKINIFLVMLTVMTIWSCEPLADDLDTIEADLSISKDITYTLDGDDYDLADEACSCAGFGSFDSEDDVKSAVPVVLADRFPALSGNSSARVTYKFFNGSSPDLRGTEFTYTVSDQEYDDLGFRFGNFSNLGRDLPIYASFKEPNAEDGDYMDITHEFFDGSGTSIVTNRAVYTVAYGWQYAFILPDNEYGDYFNESGIDFSFRDEGFEKMPIYLNELRSKFVDAGETLVVQFNYDDNGPTPEVALYIFDGSQWLLYNDHYQVVDQEFSFGYTEAGWVADNTIKLTLGSDAFTSIGNAYAESNPDGSSSVLRFSNFDVSLWTSAQVFEAITNYLEGTVPSVDGQKYLVTYAVWNNPGAGTGELYVIYSDADGGYILFEG